MGLLYSTREKAQWNEPRHEKTNNVAVRPAKTQISLGICPVWAESTLCTYWVAKDPSFLRAGSEDSDQTRWMPRLIWVSLGAHSLCWFCLWLATQTLKVELGLVSPVSRYCDWVWYHFKRLGHDTSVRQHYKSEHWALCHNQTPSWYDWKIVESDVKPEQTTTALH